jgi:hypothetical protein
MMNTLRLWFRYYVAKLLVPLMLLTGFRFNQKKYRMGVTWWHRLVHALIDTTFANRWCGMSDEENRPW